MEALLHKELTGAILKCFYTVYNRLGYGFLEKVYENALIYELKKSNFSVENQKPINVYYENQVIGNYFADIVVEDKVIIELKACECLLEIHEMQLLNYLKATNIEVGLLLNFGKEADFTRQIFTNNRKKY